MPMLPIIFHPEYEANIGQHVFPTQKYRLVRDRLLSEGAVAQHDLLRPERAPDLSGSRHSGVDHVGRRPSRGPVACAPDAAASS